MHGKRWKEHILLTTCNQHVLLSNTKHMKLEELTQKMMHHVDCTLARFSFLAPLRAFFEAPEAIPASPDLHPRKFRTQRKPHVGHLKKSQNGNCGCVSPEQDKRSDTMSLNLKLGKKSPQVQARP